MKNLTAFSCTSVLKTGDQSFSKAASILFAVQDVRDSLMQNRKYFACLSSIYLTSPHVTISPKPSPSVFAYYKWSKTRGGNGI